jgi:signal transduction histidine kinase
MSAAPLHSRAIRTAAIATCLVAAVLTAVLTATDLLVEHNLIDGVDQRLEGRLGTFDAVHLVAPTLSTSLDHDFDEPILAWVIRANGTTTSTVGTPALPTSLRTTSAFTEASVNGTDFRLEGMTVPDGERVVVAASLSETSRAMGNLVVSELIIGPLLLILVFLGALLVGRRVAGPVERMRQRQLAFTADASHELRTPLSVIQAESSLGLSGDNRDLRAALGRVATEGVRMRSIIEDLLWLARYDAEPSRPKSETLDLATLAAVAADRFTAIAQQRTVHIDVDVPSAPVLISAPPEWVHRLAAVLIDNACRHARVGGRVQVQVRQTDRQRARLSVSNDGEGVPSGEMTTIFARFHRATSKGEGAGLGLAIADSVVRGTHGVWHVENLPGGGARFEVAWAHAAKTQ